MEVITYPFQAYHVLSGAAPLSEAEGLRSVVEGHFRQNRPSTTALRYRFEPPLRA